MFIDIFFNLLALLGSLLLIGIILVVAVIVLLVGKVFIEVFIFSSNELKDDRNTQRRLK